MTLIELLKHATENLEKGSEPWKGLLFDRLKYRPLQDRDFWESVHCSHNGFSLAPKTITVDGTTVSLGMDTPPAEDSTYYYPTPAQHELYAAAIWDSLDPINLTRLKQGMCFTLPSDAIAISEHMLKIPFLAHYAV